MKKFEITCEKGITYTNIENFTEEFYENVDSLTNENVDYLENYIWEAIEEYNGKIPEPLVWIMLDFCEDFTYNYEVDRETLEYNLYKGWAYIKVIIQNPETGNYYAFYNNEGKYDTEKFANGYEFERVRPAEKIIKTWETLNEYYEN